MKGLGFDNVSTAASLSPPGILSLTEYDSTGAESYKNSDIGSPADTITPASTVTDEPSNIIRRIPRPKLPVQVNNRGPYLLPREVQERIMKWKYGWHWDPPSPVWMIKPDHQKIREIVEPYLKQLGHPCHTIDIEYLAEGGFNKVYILATDQLEGLGRKEYIFRVGLPVQPYYKMESDVATTEIVRHFTDVPVPVIYAFDSSMDNPLGLEWMLMERAVGQPLFNKWYDMHDHARMQMVETVARWTQQLTAIHSDRIGAIYMKYDSTEVLFYIGPSIEFALSRDTRREMHIDRGPYSSLQELYAAVLDATDKEIDGLVAGLLDQRESRKKIDQRKDDSSTESDSEDDIPTKARKIDRHNIHWRELTFRKLRKYKDACVILTYALDELCERLPETPRCLKTYLMHNDLSASNIMIDGFGNPTALLDWEFTTLRPISICRAWPVFLSSDHQSQQPALPPPFDYVRYAHWSAKDINETLELDERTYRERTEAYRMTKLRAEWTELLQRLGIPLAAVTMEGEFDFARDLYERIIYMESKAWSHPRWVKDLTGCYLTSGDEEDEANEESENMDISGL